MFIWIGALVVAVGVGLVLRAAITLTADNAWNDGIWEGHSMIVRGLKENKLQAIVVKQDLRIEDLREANKAGTAWAFSLKPTTAYSEYARLAPSGRRGRWTCFHGFQWFIQQAFEKGAASVSTIGPNGKRKVYASLEAFRQDASAIAERQLGDGQYPVVFVDLCEHWWLNDA